MLMLHKCCVAEIVMLQRHFHWRIAHDILAAPATQTQEHNHQRNWGSNTDFPDTLTDRILQMEFLRHKWSKRNVN